jgi:predicted nucleic acid-binding protein
MSRGFLLDTDILSATSLPSYSHRVDEWIRNHEAQLYTSSINIAELSFGVDRLAAGARKRYFEQWLASLVETMGDRILGFDTRSAFTWGKLQTDLQRQAPKMPVLYSFSAAFALRQNLIVATANTADFTRTGIETINPFHVRTA